MKKNLKKFKIKSKKEEKIPCQICEKLFTKLCSIRIGTYNINKCYINNNRPMLINYIIRCCPKCFKIIIKKLEQII